MTSTPTLEAVAASPAAAAPARVAPVADLRIGAADDPFEHEAERVAERVMAGAPLGGLLPRSCACGGSMGPDGACAACRAKRLARQARSSAGGQRQAPAVVHEVLRRPGRALQPGIRAFHEQRLGHDLGAVRVHDDAKAAASADAVDAEAYTVASDVVFAAGRYLPHSPAGARLLAHELAHVVQHDGGAGRPAQLRRLVRGQSAADAREIASEFATICSDVAWSSAGHDVAGVCDTCSTPGCDCLCDVVNDATRGYTIDVMPATAGTKSETLHDGSTVTMPDSSLWPNTSGGDHPDIETLDGGASTIEFGFFTASGAARWYSPWRILAHELCGHGRNRETYAGSTGNRSGHDATIDTENAIAGPLGGTPRGHFADRRQGEAFYNPVGNRTRVAFKQVNGWHYEAP